MEGIYEFDPEISVRCVAIWARANTDYFLIWMRMVRQMETHWHRSVLGLMRSLSVNETKNPQHIDYSRSMHATHGDKRIPDSAEPRLESLYPPFVVGSVLGQTVEGASQFTAIAWTHLSYWIQVQEYAPRPVGWTMCFSLMISGLDQIPNAVELRFICD